MKFFSKQIKNYSLTSLLSLFLSFQLSSQCTGSIAIIETDPTYTFSAINYPVGFNTDWKVTAYPISITSNSSSFTHTFEYNGTYVVQLYITNPGVCQLVIDTFIIVSNGKSCQAFFTETISPNNNWERTYNPTYPKPGLSYMWDFGDGSTSTNQTPTHVYSHGVYYPTTCLTVTDTNQSSDTICEMVWGFNPPIISGKIKSGGNSIDSGMVYLMGFDTTAGTTLFVDSTRTNSTGDYIFWDIPNFSRCFHYYIVASLDTLSNNYENYNPTYYFGLTSNLDYKGKIDWNNAFSFLCDNQSSNDVNIDLVECINTGGQASVSGIVTSQIGAIGNILIIIKDGNNKPVSFTYSKSNGEFSMPNLPNGTYFLHPEITRKTTTPLQFTLSATNQDISTFVVEVNSTTVDVSIVSSIESIFPFDEIKLYPNPVQNSLNIDFGKNITTEVTINVLDISGRLISTQYFDNDTKAIINTAPLSQGTYLLKLSSQDGSQVFQFVK